MLERIYNRPLSVIKRYMNYAHYWFLDTVIRRQIPFNWLSASNLGEMANRPTHNLADADLLDTLMYLFTEGDLMLKLSGRNNNVQSLASPSRDFVQSTLFMGHDAWIQHPQSIFYGVTAQGATKWEQLSAPQWEQYYEEGYGIEPYEGDIIASERAVTEEVFGMARCDPLVGTIVPASITWTAIHPWNATYWKTLPIGHQVCFTYLPFVETDETPYPTQGYCT